MLGINWLIENSPLALIMSSFIAVLIVRALLRRREISPSLEEIARIEVNRVEELKQLRRQKWAEEQVAAGHPATVPRHKVSSL